VKAARIAGIALAAAGAFGVLSLVAYGQTRPTRDQAQAAVMVYKTAREQCAAQGQACEEQAKRRFVEVMNCVVRGQRAVDPARLDRDFLEYVDMLSAVPEGQESSSPADAGPCFAAAAAPGKEVAQPEGPTADALRRFRKQAEEQSRPVTPTQSQDVNPHERLKTDLEAMRGKTGAGPAKGPVPGLPK
jgi:hypothetical protein